MENCNDCFSGDYQTGTATLVPAREYGVNLPGLVVIPDNEIRQLIAEYPENVFPVPRDYAVNTSEDDYWEIH